MANEKRLIDANALLDALPVVKEDKKISLVGAIADFVVMIHELPTVDAVEVVRCKDCTYWEKATANKKGFLICPASGMEIMADDFCSYGERRNDV